MGANIQDEFSGLPLSRQMKYYLRKRRDKRCTKCGKALEHGSLCVEHMVQMREYRRRTFGLRRRYRNSLSYQSETGTQPHSVPGMGSPDRNAPELAAREPDLDLELGVPGDHPLRPIKRRVDSLLTKYGQSLEAAPAVYGRVKIQTTTLLKSWVLMNLYSIPSTRLFCEQLGYNLLWLWFLDRTLQQGSFDPDEFAEAYDRVLATEDARRFFCEVLTAKAG
jgi:transposase